MRATLNLMRSCRFFLTAAAFPLAAAAQGNSATNARMVSGTLSFVGHATVGDFVGSTTAVSGAVTGDLSNPRGWVESSVASLDTHNKLRDRDLRASMEVDRYPTMRLDVSGGTTDSSVAPRGNQVAMSLRGELAIHGVTRRVDIPVLVSQVSDTIHVTAEFPLDLADYQIGGLTKMFGLFRMRRQIEVRVDLRFVR